MTDRYWTAIEQLGFEKLDVRIGGIYALERIARDLPWDQPTIMEVLAAFIREHSREQWPLAEPGTEPPERTTRPDVQAAATVIGRRTVRYDRWPVDLGHADLTRVYLPRADLARANPFALADLTDADLTGANLPRAILPRADLARANPFALADLTDADLTGANLPRAILPRANLPRANLALADLTDADLTGANLTGANLHRAILHRADLAAADLAAEDLAAADLTNAILTRAILRRADLTGADLAAADLAAADLTAADLAGAVYPDTCPVPAGWERDPGSGRLGRASKDADDAGN